VDGVAWINSDENPELTWIEVAGASLPSGHCRIAGGRLTLPHGSCSPDSKRIIDGFARIRRSIDSPGVDAGACVRKDRLMPPGPDLLTGSVMSTTFLALRKDVHGIGYSVFYYHEFMSPPTTVKACAVEGILPTSESIRSRQYPLLSEVYVVVRSDLPPDHPACRLRDWMLSPTGQGIVEESGYVAVRTDRDSASQTTQPAFEAAECR
jgi:hypothetical protein